MERRRQNRTHGNWPHVSQPALGHPLRRGGIHPPEADRRGMLGTAIVVGTNAVPVPTRLKRKAASAPGWTKLRISLWHGSGIWCWRQHPRPIHHVDLDHAQSRGPTYTVNSERPFRREMPRPTRLNCWSPPVEATSLERGDRPAPIPLPEQEWLLNGRFVDHVVCGRDGSAARVVAPDPAGLPSINCG